MADEKQPLAGPGGLFDPAALWEQVARPWEETAIASLEQIIHSRPALAALFAPLRLWLEGLASTKQWNEQLLGGQGAATQADLGEITGLIRRLESRLLDLEDRVIALEERGRPGR